MITPHLVVHDSPDALAHAVARTLTRLVAEAIAARGACTLVVAGGRTPRAIYERLADAPIDWARVTIYFGDERAVPPDDPASNHHMLAAALVDRLGAVRPRVHRIAGELGAEEAARNYAALLGPLERFDVVLLGVGDDGHVASIFPASGLPHDDAPALATQSPVPPHQRVSMSLARLAHTRALLVLVTGAAKAERLRDVHGRIARADPGLPASRIASLVAPDTRFSWHVDAAAGALLPRPPETPA